MPAATAICPCHPDDFTAIGDVINSAAVAYAGVIPSDRYRIPYMAPEDLEREIAAGVRFWGWYERTGESMTPGQSVPVTAPREPGGQLLGVMGVQGVDDATLIRHAYVLPAHQRKGIGKNLLRHLASTAEQPLYVGTWADAIWAVRFYERNGFALVTPAEKDRLLRRYWSIPERQVATSVVLRHAETTKGAGS